MSAAQLEREALRRSLESLGELSAELERRLCDDGSLRPGDAALVGVEVAWMRGADERLRRAVERERVGFLRSVRSANDDTWEGAIHGR